jgi:hypothetical protein
VKTADPQLRARYRVLVVKNEPPANVNLPVLAICLEQNLVGRGRTAPEALADLARTLFESFKHEWENLVPAARPDPDPELVEVFEKDSPATREGDLVLQRLYMSIEINLVAGSRARLPKRPPRVVYETCPA